ncbi:hypothetical protein ARMGADRAFT_1033790 [Armillaria gallica]|uniref:Uncharacterized protein n=1 Tax=Armillaria gallica TaxID=47427 RepID=A0A2H3DBM2_ARMGA|nr:hypothetical protein ARMGADRAFT_1033790 [Armillaria gallica]
MTPLLCIKKSGPHTNFTLSLTRIAMEEEQIQSKPSKSLDLIGTNWHHKPLPASPCQGHNKEPMPLPPPPALLAPPPAIIIPPTPKPSTTSDDLKLPHMLKNKKGWLKGPVLKFLETKHLPHFLELYEDASAHTWEYAETACNDLHSHFDFCLPMNVVPESPYDPNKMLSTEEKLLKTVVLVWDRVSVLNWLCKEASKPGSLKGMALYQLWVKEEGEKEREVFRVAFKELGEPAHSHAGWEAVHLVGAFAQLPQNIQDGYKSQVAEEKRKALEEQERMKQLLDEPLPPKEAQKMIDWFEHLISPFLGQVARLTGMKIFMVMGSVEPHRGVIIMVFGEFLTECYNRLLCFKDKDKDESKGEELDAKVPVKKWNWKGKGVLNQASEKPELSKRKRAVEEKVLPKKRKKSKTGGGGGQVTFIECSGAPRGKKKDERVSKKVAASIGKSLANIDTTKKASSTPAVPQALPSSEQPPSPSFSLGLMAGHPQSTPK